MSGFSKHRGKLQKASDSASDPASEIVQRNLRENSIDQHVSDTVGEYLASDPASEIDSNGDVTESVTQPTESSTDIDVTPGPVIADQIQVQNDVLAALKSIGHFLPHGVHATEINTEAEKTESNTTGATSRRGRKRGNTLASTRKNTGYRPPQQLRDAIDAACDDTGMLPQDVYDIAVVLLMQSAGYVNEQQIHPELVALKRRWTSSFQV